MIETSPQHNDALFQTTADPGARLLPRSGGLPGVHNRLTATDPATRELRFAPLPSRRSRRHTASEDANDAEAAQESLKQTTSDHGSQSQTRHEARTLHGASFEAAQRQLEGAAQPPISKDVNGESQDASGTAATSQEAAESEADSPVNSLRDAESLNVRALATDASEDHAHPAQPSPVQALKSLIESARCQAVTMDHPGAAGAEDLAQSVAAFSHLADSQLPASADPAPRRLNRGLNRLTPKNDPLSRKLRRKLERIREKQERGATDSSPAAASNRKSRRKSKSYVGRIAPRLPHAETAAGKTAKDKTTASTPVVAKTVAAISESERTVRSNRSARPTGVRPKADSSAPVERGTKPLSSDHGRTKSTQQLIAQPVASVSDDASRSANKPAAPATNTRSETSKKQRAVSADTAATQRTAGKHAAKTPAALASNSYLLDVERLADERAANERFTDRPRKNSHTKLQSTVAADSETPRNVEPAAANDSDIAGPMYVDLQQFTESRIDVTFLSCHQTDHHFSAPSPVFGPTRQPSPIVGESKPAALKSAPASSCASPEQPQDELTDEEVAEDHCVDEALTDETQHTWLNFDQLDPDDQRPHKRRAREQSQRLAEHAKAKPALQKTATARTQSHRSSSSRPTVSKAAVATLDIPTAQQLRRSNGQNSSVSAKNASKSESRKTAAGLTALTLVEPVPAPVEPYTEWFRRVVLRNRGMMLFTTFYLHWLILLLLAVMIVHAPENPAALLITATFSNDEPTTEAFEVVTREPEPILEEDFVPEPEPLATERVAEMEERELEIDDSFLDNLHPHGVHAASDQATANSGGEVSDSENTANPHEYRDTSPVQAVREGSFSVWTDPPHPKPGESYRLIIQVKLPPHVKTYPITDLQGVVVGSDGYRKPIPGFMKGDLPILDGYVRLAVPIVSADKKVCDTVFIRSKLLRETQKLMVEFR